VRRHTPNPFASAQGTESQRKRIRGGKRKRPEGKRRKNINVFRRPPNRHTSQSVSKIVTKKKGGIEKKTVFSVSRGEETFKKRNVFTKARALKNNTRKRGEGSPLSWSARQKASTW